MKVPTYQSQAPIPKQGQGLFLTAQLDAGAMMAPGRAFAAQGQQLAQKGNQLAAWGFKKAQIGAESEAQKAAALMEVELADKSLISLQNPDMSQAESQFRRAAKLLAEKYGKTLSNSLARTAFASQALRLQTRAMIGFTKTNNRRVVEAQKSNLTKTTLDYMKTASDPSQSYQVRLTAEVSGYVLIQDAVSNVGADEVRIRTENFYEDIVQNTLINLSNQPGADVAVIATAFRQGTSRDDIVQRARKNLTAKQIDSIATSLEKVGARNAKRDNDARKERDTRDQNFDESIVREIYFGDGTPEHNDHLFSIIENSIHIPVSTLRAVQNYLSGGAQVDNAEDVLELSRMIRNDEIKTDADLFFELDGRQITFNTVRMMLLPLLTTKTDRAFTKALEWGEAALNYDKSAASSGLQIFKDTALKAAKLREEMLAWQYDKKKTIKDPMAKAKEITERLLKLGNQTALNVLPIMVSNYRKVLKDGDPTKIANARQALISVMITGGLVTPLAAAGKDFDPLAIIDKKSSP